MQLNEQIYERSDVSRENLPKGVLARVWYKIMRFGTKNANNRVYERKCAEKVLTDKDITKKLNTKTLFGDQEHPELSQIKLDWRKTSHFLSDMRINESDNTLEAAFDILPTEPGKFINILLEAGCQVGVSTRADGELEEAVDESGNRYSRVIPEKYLFRSVDFTGDPSTPNTVPEKIIRATQSHYESKDIDKTVAMALLEYVNTPESKSLLEIVKNDKQHPSCKCSLTSKTCNSGCAHAIPEAKAEPVKVGSLVKVQEKRGIVAHVFPRTQKAIVQFTDCKEAVKISECCLLEEINPVSAETEQVALKLFNKSYKDLSFAEKEQVLSTSSNTSTPPAPTDKSLTPPIVEIPPTTPEVGFYRDGKGELLFVKEVKGDKVVVARQAGNEVIIPVADFIKLEAKVARDAKQFPEANARENVVMDEAINKILKSSVNEISAEEDSNQKASAQSDIDFEGALWQKPAEFLKGLSADLVKTWTPEQQRIFQQVIKRKELGENKVEEKLTTSSDKSGQPANAEAADKVAKKSAAKNAVKIGEAVIELDVKISQYLSDNWDSFATPEEAARNLMSTFRISSEEAASYVSKRKQIETQPSTSESINTVAYINEIINKTTEITALKNNIIKNECNYNVAITKLQEQVTELSAELVSIKETTTKSAKEFSAKLDEAKKKNAFLIEKLKNHEELSNKAIAIQEAQLQEATDLASVQEQANAELRAEIKKLSESKKAELESLKESHKKDLIKIYVESRVGGLGLKLPKTTLTLLENCKNSAEVDSMIHQTQNAIREGIVHTASINEIVQRSEIVTSPMQRSIDNKIENVLKNLGV